MSIKNNGKLEVEVRTCFQCGSKTLMELISTGDRESVDYIDYDPWIPENSVTVAYWERWKVWFCHACEKVSLEA